jgi:hypothetical protein
VPTREEIDEAKSKLRGASMEDLQKISGISAPSTQNDFRAQVEAEKQKLRGASPQELNSIAYGIEPEKSGLQKFGESILGGVQKVGEYVDKYTGAPSRSAFSELTRTTPEFAKPEPSVIGNIQAASKSFANQFGADPSLATSEKEIAEKRLGFSTDQSISMSNEFGMGGGFGAGRDLVGAGGDRTPAITVSPAGMAGVGIGFLIDPLTIIPGATIVKGAKYGAKAAGSAAKGLGSLGVKGARAVGAGEIINIGEDVARGAANAFKSLTSASVSKDAQKFLDVATKHGIDVSDVDAINYGKNTAINRLSRMRKQTIGGEDAAEIFNNKIQQVQQATVDYANKVGGGSIPKTVEQAGDLLGTSLANARSKFFSTIDTSYNKIAKANPGLKLSDDATEVIQSKLSEVKDLSDRLFKTRGTRARAVELRNYIDDFKDTGSDFQQTTDVLRNMREVIFSPIKNDSPFLPQDISKLRELSNSVSDALLKTVDKSVSPEAALALKKANERMSHFFSETRSLNRNLNSYLDGTLAPEKLYESLIKNGNSNTISSVKSVLNNSQDLKALQGFSLDDLLARNANGDRLDFSFAKTASSLKNRNKLEKLSAFVDPNDLSEFVNLVDLGDNFGPAILNFSETGLANILKGGASEIINTSGLLEGALGLQKRRAIRNAAPILNAPAAAPRFGDLIGPQAIGAKEAIGLRLPQQISRQQQEKRK